MEWNRTTTLVGQTWEGGEGENFQLQYKSFRNLRTSSNNFEKR
jgi:hypothetical protein